jgi:anti-sigma factor RsiW
MTSPLDPISDADLHAYVDDQLTPARRIAVEAYLAQHPQLAAEVMADLRLRDELRLVAAEPPTAVPMPGIHDAARRLQNALARDAVFARMRRVAAMAALVGLGWLAHGEVLSIGNWNGASASAMPAYVGEAARAHKTALLRASMHSQPVETNFNREEIRSATSIRMPDLPPNWQILDVEIFPSSEGPAVEVAIKTAELGTLSLFAVRQGKFGVLPATMASSAEVTAVYWQVGDAAYALVGAAKSDALNKAAAQLAATLY